MDAIANLDIRYLDGCSSIDDFGSWAAAQPRLALSTVTTGRDPRTPGFAVEHLGFGSADGSAYVLDGRDIHLCRRALRIAKAADRHLWAHDASVNAVAIAYSYQLRVTDLRCSLVAARWLWPGLQPQSSGHSLASLRPAAAAALERLTLGRSSNGSVSNGRWFTRHGLQPPPRDALLTCWVATAAVETARLVEGIAGIATTDERVAILDECELEEHWCWAGALGYRVDESQLQQETASIEQLSRNSLQRWDIDLSRNGAETHAWLTKRGIRSPETDNGRRSMKAGDLAQAEVPAEMQADWLDFLAARRLNGVSSKLKEISRHLYHGRVHPTIAVNGAITGRMTSTTPSLHNVAATLRGILHAEEGQVLIGCDLDSVEPKIVAALSGDPALRAAVRGDVYTELAVAIWGESARGDSAKRKLAKTGFLAQLYGQGIKGLGAALGVPTAEATHLVDGLRGAYPDLFAWIRGREALAREGTTLRTLTGRSLPSTRSEPYKAVNWTVQGSAADLFKACNRRAADSLGGGALWLPIHDELIIQVEDDPSVIASAKAELEAAMTSSVEGVTIGGRAELLGTRWKKAG